MKSRKRPARKAARATPKKRVLRQAPKRAAKTGRTKSARSGAYADFMVQAYAMENDARDRYTEFADQMEVHNNREVAQLFRKLARIEGLHAERIVKEMGWRKPPSAAEAWMWRQSEAPESVPSSGELHYLMQPYHALELALQCEQRAASFFTGITRSTAPADVKRIAKAMAADERDHVRLIQDWMRKVEKPHAGWDIDLDPPTYSE
ncbi:MAG: rubrerythrin [Betaproteobacteria bacterium]|nr:MAG: rubrerythrin [Betaproteobacteria bacterium]